MTDAAPLRHSEGGGTRGGSRAHGAGRVSLPVPLNRTFKGRLWRHASNWRFLTRTVAQDGETAAFTTVGLGAARYAFATVMGRCEALPDVERELRRPADVWLSDSDWSMRGMTRPRPAIVIVMGRSRNQSAPDPTRRGAAAARRPPAPAVAGGRSRDPRPPFPGITAASREEGGGAAQRFGRRADETSSRSRVSPSTRQTE